MDLFSGREGKIILKPPCYLPRVCQYKDVDNGDIVHTRRLRSNPTSRPSGPTHIARPIFTRSGSNVDQNKICTETPGVARERYRSKFRMIGKFSMECLSINDQGYSGRSKVNK